MANKEKKTKKFPIGKLIAVIIIALVAACVINPGLLWFLTPEQQQVIAEFQKTYFTTRNPVQTEGGGFDPLVLVSIVILLAECWALMLIIKLVMSKLTLKSRHAETIKGLIGNCLKYAVAIYAVVFSLSVLGVNMVAVIAFLGVLGLIIGFGAESLIADVITGLFIIFEGQIRVGDIVTIDGFRGTVSAIGIRTTQVTDSGGNIKIMNNSDIRTLTNLSDVDSVAVATISIAYEADLVEAEEVVKQTLAEMPKLYPDIFNKKTPSYLCVENLGASSVDLKVAAAVDEPNIYSARRLLNRELKLAMDRAGINIPYNQIVVHSGE